MSEAVKRRLVEILGYPTRSPYGNPIPGLAELGGGGAAPSAEAAFPGELVTLAEAPETAPSVVVRRITEQLQSDTAVLALLDGAGVRPNALVAVSRADGRLLTGTGDQETELDHAAAAHILVAAS
jgi:DtxR family transcriptional regulator, Mn-dependent transcriptional regulator